MLASTRADVSLRATAAGQVGRKVALTARWKLRDKTAAKLLLTLLEPAATGDNKLSRRG